MTATPARHSRRYRHSAIQEATMESVDLTTNGMHCSSCSMLIEMEVGDLDGVSSVKADYGTGTTHVEFDPIKVTEDQIIIAIQGAGYEAEVAA
jgi:copper chaperone CopZ